MFQTQYWSTWIHCVFCLVSMGNNGASLQIHPNNLYQRHERSLLPSAEPTKKQNYAHMEDQIAAVFNKVAFESGSFKPTFRVQVPPYLPTDATSIDEMSDHETIRTVSSKLSHQDNLLTRPNVIPTKLAYPEWFTLDAPTMSTTLEPSPNYPDKRVLSSDISPQPQPVNVIEKQNISNWNHLYGHKGDDQGTQGPSLTSSVEQKEHYYEYKFHSLFTLMVPNFKDATELYGVAWDIHTYITSTLMSALGVCGLIAVLAQITEQKMVPPTTYCVFHIFVLILSITRGSTFFCDPYNLEGFLPHIVGNSLFDIGSPSMTVMFGILIRCLLRRATISTIHQHTRLSLLFWIALGGQLVIVLASDIIAYLLPSLSILYLTSSLIYITSMISLSALFAWIIKQVTNSVNSSEAKVKFLPKRMIDSNTRFALIICSWVTMLVIVSTVTTLYYVIDVIKVLQGSPNHLWPWWTYQFTLRMLEILIAYLLLYTSTFTLCDKQPGDNKSPVICCSINTCLERCQQKLPICREDSINSSERDDCPELYMTHARIPASRTTGNYLNRQTCTLPVSKPNHKADTALRHPQSTSRTSLNIPRFHRSKFDLQGQLPSNESSARNPRYCRTLSTKMTNSRKFVPVDTCRSSNTGQLVVGPTTYKLQRRSEQEVIEQTMYNKSCDSPEKIIVQPDSVKSVSNQMYYSPSSRPHSNRRRTRSGSARQINGVDPRFIRTHDSRQKYLGHSDIYNIPYSQAKDGLAEDSSGGSNTDGKWTTPKKRSSINSALAGRHIKYSNKETLDDKSTSLELDNNSYQSDSESFHEYSDWLLSPYDNEGKSDALRCSRSYSCTPRERSVASDSQGSKPPRFSSQIKLDISASGTPELQERKSVYLSNITLQIGSSSPTFGRKVEHVPSTKISSTSINVNGSNISS